MFASFSSKTVELIVERGVERECIGLESRTGRTTNSARVRAPNQPK